jgi:hypothetical protein
MEYKLKKRMMIYEDIEVQSGVAYVVPEIEHLSPAAGAVAIGI